MILRASAGNVRDHTIISLALGTGLRLAEIVGVEDARRRIEAWRHDYNEQRPHRSIGRVPPAVFARRAAALQAPTAPSGMLHSASAPAVEAVGFVHSTSDR